MSSYDASSNSKKIEKDFNNFDSLLKLSDYFLSKRDFETSAVFAQLAASQAFVNHCGVFASYKLEKILNTIGCNTIDPSDIPITRNLKDTGPLNVLHVLNSGRKTGGDTRFVWRWINEDSGRRHSVALTRQRNGEVPLILRDAVERVKGSIHILDKENSTLTAQACKLRRISEGVDLVVLHIFPDDVTPLIAYGDKRNLPPIIFINHSDHTFWLGVTISDLIVHLRECSLQLSRNRRGLPDNKIAFLPTPLGLLQRELSRSQAKQKLGFPEDVLIILTVATAFKYESIGDANFVDIILPTISKNRKVLLLAIGPSNSPMWQFGYSVTDGRIVTLGERSDTSLYYQAADIYVDSFPFSSITSLLEAGSYGLPLVSYCLYSDESVVLSAGAPGLQGVMLRVNSIQGVDKTLCQLIDREQYRLDIGEQTRINIIKHHCSNGWLEYLHTLYSKVFECMAANTEEGNDCVNKFDELDISLNRLYDSPGYLGRKITQYTSLLSYVRRLRILICLLRIDRSFSLSLFLPGWIAKRVSGRFGWIRKLAVFR